MSFSEKCCKVFEQATKTYHVTDRIDTMAHNPYPVQSIEFYLYLKNWFDAAQWHMEDLLRSLSATSKEYHPLIRRIDKADMDRMDLIELIDRFFLDQYKEVQPLPDAGYNTESPAWAIDRLSILTLKIYHMEQACERTDLPAEQKAKQEKNLCLLREQKHDLSLALDQLLADIKAGRKYMKVYKQSKLYDRR